MNIDLILRERGYDLSLLGDRLDIIVQALVDTEHLKGELWECGAYNGGTALYMAAHTKDPILAFDTFEGLPVSGEHDLHKVGAMKVEHDMVAARFADVPNIRIIRGMMPATFVGLEDSHIRIAHIDVDQYESVKAVLEFVYPRVVPGGYIIIDDYLCGSCPGARKAVDDFMVDKPEVLVAPGGCNPQAYFIKTS